MRSAAGVVAIVAWPGDPLADAVEETLRRRRRPVLRLEPGTLSCRRVSLDPGGLRLEGRPVRGVLWRVRPDSPFSADVAPDDRSFADVETRALWLAALHAGNLEAPFRPEAAAFFTGGGWPLWRRRLAAADVPLSPFAYGASAGGGEWLPYHHGPARPALGASAARALGAATMHRAPGRRVLLTGGDALDIETGRRAASRGARAAAAALEAAGVAFARIDLDTEDAVIGVDPFPVLRDPALVDRAAARLAELFDGASDRR